MQGNSGKFFCLLRKMELLNHVFCIIASARHLIALGRGNKVPGEGN